jgi:hypothetical protein
VGAGRRVRTGSWQLNARSSQAGLCLPLNEARTPAKPWDTPSATPAQIGEAALNAVLDSSVPTAQPRGYGAPPTVGRREGHRVSGESAKAPTAADDRRQRMVSEQQGRGVADTGGEARTALSRRASPLGADVRR